MTSDFLLPHEFRPRTLWPEVAGAAIAGAAALAMLTLAVVGADERGFGRGVSAMLGGTGIALAVLAGWFAARLADRGPVVRVTAKGIVSSQLDQPLRWTDVDSVELDPNAGRWSLRLRTGHGKAVNHSFWSRRDPAVHQVELYRLNALQRLRVLQLARQHLARAGRHQARSAAGFQVPARAVPEGEMKWWTMSNWAA
jgi:hypothetical protein